MDSVVHFEIPAADVKRAEKFYSTIFGWKMDPQSDMNYTLVQTAEVGEDRRPKERGIINGGMMKRSNDVSAPVVYMYVKEINDTIKKIEKQGGSVVQGKTHVMGSMYTAYFKDSEGNVMGLVQGMM